MYWMSVQNYQGDTFEASTTSSRTMSGTTHNIPVRHPKPVQLPNGGQSGWTWGVCGYRFLVMRQTSALAVADGVIIKLSLFLW